MLRLLRAVALRKCQGTVLSNGISRLEAAPLRRASTRFGKTVCKMPSASKRSARALESDDDSEEIQPSQPKRAKPGAYAKGSVMKIRVHNFMVYRDVEVVPGSRLNLILGPNGTGKSTLVCALCLGLAGKPSLLGRADSTQHFVLQGETEGWVEITLSEDDEGRPLTVKRILKTADNSSEWKLNSRNAREKDVVERIKTLNVQLDNLCQFVPQDRVSEFARKKPDELLTETQKAIGDSTLYNLHQELITHSKELKAKESSKGLLDSQLETARGQNVALQRDVERFEQREQLLAEELLARKKMAWVKVHEAQEQLKEDKEKLTESKELLKTKRRELQEAEAPKREKQNAMDQASKREKDLNRASRATEEEVHAVSGRLNELAADTENKWEELEGLNEKENERLGKISQQQRAVDQAKEKLERAEADLADTSDRKSADEIRAMFRDATDKDNNARGFQNELDDLKMEQERFGRTRTQFSHQLNQLKDQRMQRLRWLDQKHRGMVSFADWLSKNQSRYRAKVYGPVLTEINVQNATHQRFAEQQLGMALLARFVTQTAEDLEMVQNDARDKFKLKIVVTHYTGNAQQVLLHPDGDASKYERYGVTHTMDEVIECAPIIKHVLNDERGTSRTYLANDQCNAGRFLHENPGISSLFTPRDSYRVVKSAYNPNARSETVQTVNHGGAQPLGMGGASVDEECADIQANINALDMQMADVQRQEQGLNARFQAANKEAEALRNQARQANDAIRQLQSKKNKADQVHNRERAKLTGLQKAKSLLEDEPKIKADIARMNAAAATAMDKLKAALSKQLDLLTQHAIADLTHVELKTQVAKLVRETKAQQDEVDRITRLVDILEREVDSRRIAVRETRKAAEEEYGPLTPEVREQLNDLPTSLEALEELAQDKRKEADDIVCSNPGIMQEYQQRCATIASLEAQTSDLRDQISLLANTIAERKERWAPELVRIVGQINENFGSNFRDIASAGEVSLGVLGREHDAAPNFDDPSLEYEKLAIHIKVKFRDDEDLNLLTPMRQSGGERALTTMLYLIAIQGVTVCPFRVVDEINQGMDQIYERQVFKLLSIAAGRPGTPQCFLLTPKLLNDLPYSPEVTILNIVNGPHLQHVRRPFSQAQLLGSRQRLVPAAA